MARSLRKPPGAALSRTTARLEGSSLERLTGLSREQLTGMFRKMSLIREFEEQSAALYRSGRIRGVTHTYQGQEAVAVGAVWSAASRRLHLVHPPRATRTSWPRAPTRSSCMAELMGKATGYCQGRGGSMHIADMSRGILGANGIVGGGIGLAAGSALASLMQGNGRVTVCFFGDGALNEGILHEVSNLSAIWKLPCVFLCENNLYGMSGPVDEMLALGEDGFLGRPAAYGIPGVECDGMDVVDVFLGVKEAVERARRGEGPSYVICHTYRFLGHHVGDPLTYRDKDEPALWRRLDPIPNYGRPAGRSGPGLARGTGGRGPGGGGRRRGGRGLRGRQPGARLRHRDGRVVLMSAGERTLSYAQALNEALREEMRRDPAVMLMGEDIGVWGGGGVFGVTRGLLDEFGADRVRDTPISEAGFTGLGVGAALAGLRPVVEYMYIDFAMLAMDQICNQAAKIRWMLGGGVDVPLVIRAQQGAGRGNGPQHSQSLEAWFTHNPGLTVVLPSTPYDAKGLLKTAIRSNDPGDLPGAQAALRGERSGARDRLHRALRAGGCAPGGQGRHLRGHLPHEPEGPGGRGHPGRRGHRAGGHRPADPRPLRPRRPWPARSPRRAGCW